MKFGKIDQPQLIDFTLPADHRDTATVLSSYRGSMQAAVGCAKWNRQDLKNFYPRGTKDELVYYSSQFNSIELNATFYRLFSFEQFEKWHDKTPPDFKFFPKISQEISHWKRLSETSFASRDLFLEGVSGLKGKLGTIFLQLHSNFSPQNRDRLFRFIEKWPKTFKLALECRHTLWYNDDVLSLELFEVLRENNVANVLVDTAGRRDLLHMRLSNNEAFVRYVGANHSSDRNRLLDWIARIKVWQKQGLEKVHFFVHQNLEKESPLLAREFIQHLNPLLENKITVPTEILVKPKKE